MRLALPAAGTQLSVMLMGLVDIAMVGRLSVNALASLSIANVWIMGTVMFAQGVIMGLDPIVSQAHGARDGRRAGVALQRGMVVALLLSLPLGGLFFVTEEVLVLFGQDPELSRAAGVYARVQIPSLPFFLVFCALRQYLQGREIVRPTLWLIVVANLLNVVLNWALIFGHFGVPALGLLGAGVATAITRVLVCLGLVVLIRAASLHRGAWVPWSREALRLEGLREVLGYGTTIAVQVSLEMWAFSAASLLAGWLGAIPLAAHTVALNLAGLTFMLPLGISMGAVTRVGNLLGAGAPAAAQRAAWVAVTLGGGVMSVSALGFVILREGLPRLFTPEATVIALCSAILPIAAAFQIFDGVQAVACGVLRGMGRVRPALIFNLVSYWLVGLPLGAWLAFRADYGLAGIWWGLCIGLGVVSVLLVFWIAQRGPARIGTAPLPTPPAGPERPSTHPCPE